jgi:O-antigen/teichoic acid export membrane protein
MSTIGERGAAPVASFLRGSSLIFGLRIAGMGISLATQLLLARWMPTDELGQLVYALAVVNLLGLLATLGYSSGALRFLPQYRTNAQADLAAGYISRGYWTACFGGAAMAIVTLIAVLVAPARHGQGVDLSLLLAALCVPIMSVLIQSQAVAHALSRFALAFAPRPFLRPLLLMLGVAGLHYGGQELTAPLVMAFFLGFLLLMTAGHACLVARAVRTAFQSSSRDFQTRLWLTTGMQLFLLTLFSNSFLEINIVTAGWFLPEADIAILNVGFLITNLIGADLFALNAAFAPQASEAYGRRQLDEFQRLVTLALRLRFWPSIGALVGLWYFGKDILGYFGPQFVAGYVPMLVLALLQVVVAGAGPLAQILSLTGHQRRSLPVFAVAIPLIVIMNLVLAPRLGILGSALAALLVTVYWNISLLFIVMKHVGVRPSVLHPRVSRYLMDTRSERRRRRTE